VSNSGVHLYRNQKALPRAWFVDSLEVVTEASKILERLGNPNFDPRKLALVEQEIPRIQAPDSSYVKQSEYGLQSLKYEVFTNKDAYMVLSEVYYPAGWKAYLDGNLTQIYPTNYILRGVVIPSGKHTLEMRFMPDSYQKSLVLSLSGLLITILAVIGGFLLQYKNKLKHKENDI
ncbi:MAG: YfhO family protein, partial [Candidatus Cloacimonetes bacterium]|nr:YfhO family protein [Candidatus Cloacimonadota bacterium]